MTKKSSVLILLTGLIFTSCGLLSSPTIQTIDTHTAEISGVLGKKFHKKFEKFIAENPIVKDLVLVEIPGSMNDEWNVKTCMLLNQKGMNTHLDSNSMIASGGVDLFVSGKHRTIAKGARIGVHSWRDLKKDGSEYPRDSEEHKIFLDFFEKIEIDTAFYWFTLRAAPGKDIHWMTEQEIQQYGLEN